MLKNLRTMDLTRKEAETEALKFRDEKHFSSEVKHKKKSDRVIIYIALAVSALILLSFLL
ncbi:hypothetical protein [Faecalibacillus intestinalis]|uniref:hypothetical protein n=1 Tax=Faecalibacillus intestinalis TaxID=1982626 RepID=UPI003992F8D4